jgi:hypothetical protein
VDPNDFEVAIAAKFTPAEDDLLSRIEALYTVRVSANVPARGREIDLHFVNYNREEPADPKTSGTGTVDEKPIAVAGVTVDLALPPNQKVSRVEAITPESPDPVAVIFTINNDRLKCTVPEFLVYSVIRIHFAK